jgi:hypothetical protein
MPYTDRPPPPIQQGADTYKPLNPRQELYAQALARGLSHRAAYREAGYRGQTTCGRPLHYSNVRARVAQLMAETNARNRVTIEEITDRLLAIIERNEAGDTAAAQSVARQALMDLAKMHGLLGASAGPAARFNPPQQPITEIRRIIVEPDGRMTDYSGNPVD